MIEGIFANVALDYDAKLWRYRGRLSKPKHSPQITLWMSHSGDTSGTSCVAMFSSTSGEQVWSVTTTSNLPAGTSANRQGDGQCSWSGRHEVELRVSTWGVGLEVSDGWSSAHGDELGPKLRRFLKNQKDPQSLERAAARVPGERQMSLFLMIFHHLTGFLKKKIISNQRWSSENITRDFINTILPFYNGIIGPNASGQQVVPVVEQLIVFAAVSNPQVWHTGNATGQTQQVLLRATVLVCNQQTLIRCFTLQRRRDASIHWLFGSQQVCN